MPEYVQLAVARVRQALAGTLKTRPMNRPVYDPRDAGGKLSQAPWAEAATELQPILLEDAEDYSANEDS